MKTAHLITFGLGGHGIELGTNRASGLTKCSLSGYERPETFDWASYADRYVIPDGCPVIDKRKPLESNWRLAVASPMVDVELPPNSWEDAPIPSDTLLDGLEDTFKTLASLAASKPRTGFTGMDMVDVATYIHWWRERGARIGQVQNGTFVWED